MLVTVGVGVAPIEPSEDEGVTVEVLVTVGVGVNSATSGDGVKVGVVVTLGVAVEEIDIDGVIDGVIELVKDIEGVMLGVNVILGVGEGDAGGHGKFIPETAGLMHATSPLWLYALTL